MPELSGMIQEFLEGNIKSIGGKQPVIQSKTITENGTYNTPSGVDGFNPVVVNVPSQEPNIQPKSIFENGTYNVPSGVDGFNPVVVDVPMKEEITLNATTNGTYTPSEGRVYNNVIVNVPLPQNAYLLKSVANLPQTIASFNDGQEMIMPSLKVAIEPQQEGSGDPSPTNVRPISGWIETNIVVSPTTDAEDGTTYTIQFTVNGETKTIYSGYVEIVNGKVKAVATTGYVDLGTLSWAKQSVSGKTIFITTKEIDDAKKSSGLNLIQGILCSDYKEETWAHILNTSGYDGYICIGGTNRSYIAVNDTRYNNSTASEFKEALNGVQLLYKLATPIEYDLADVSINTFLGSNNVWADTGDITDAEYFSKEG